MRDLKLRGFDYIYLLYIFANYLMINLIIYTEKLDKFVKFIKIFKNKWIIYIYLKLRFTNAIIIINLYLIKKANSLKLHIKMKKLWFSSKIIVNLCVFKNTLLN